MKRFAASFSVLCLSVLAVVSARAECETIDGIGWYYSIRDGEAKIEGVWIYDTVSYRLRVHETAGTTSGDYVYKNRYVYKLISLVVPSELGGFPVSSIASIDVQSNYGSWDGYRECLPQWQEISSEPEDNSWITTYESFAFESITLPEGLKNIEYCNYYDSVYGGRDPFGEVCKEITIPNSVTNIGSSAFVGCPLRSVRIGTGVRTVGKGAFSGCPIERLRIPGNVKKIEEAAFAGSGTESGSLVIEDGVESIGKRAFAGYQSTSSIWIPDSVTNIGERAFVSSKFSSAKLPNASSACWEFMADYDYRTCGRPGESYASFTSWQPGETFADCDNLSSVVIPGGLQIIPPHSFENCIKLRRVDIGEGIISIGAFAFADCHRMGSLTIPDSVKSIGRRAFSHMSWGTWLSSSRSWVKCLIVPTSAIVLYGEGDSHEAFYDTYLEEIHCPLWTDRSWLLDNTINTNSCAYYYDPVEVRSAMPNVEPTVGRHDILCAREGIHPYPGLSVRGQTFRAESIVPDPVQDGIRYVCSGWELRRHVPYNWIRPLPWYPDVEEQLASGSGSETVYFFHPGVTTNAPDAWIHLGDWSGEHAYSGHTGWQDIFTWFWETNVWISCEVSGDASSAFAGEWTEMGTNRVDLSFAPHGEVVDWSLSGDADGVEVDVPGRRIAIPADRPRSVHVAFTARERNKAEAGGQSLLWPSDPGTDGWFLAEDEKAAGDGYSLRSAPAAAGSTSAVEVAVAGPGTLEFDWRIEANRSDRARFALDGTEEKAINREPEWLHESFEIPAGAHVLRWTYEQHAATAPGAAYLDNVLWLPRFPLTVSGEQDATVPAAGTTNVAWGETVSSSAGTVPGNGVRWVCTGWTGTGSVPATGTGSEVSFLMTSPSTIRWHWRRECRIDVSVEGLASTAFASGWYPEGSPATVEIAPRTHLFDIALFGDTDGAVLEGTTLTVPADGPRTISVRVSERKLPLRVESAEGAPFPGVGTIQCSWGDPVSAAVSEPEPMDGVWFECTGWTGTGSVPASGGGTNVEFTIEEPSSLTWTWRTNVWIELSAMGPVSLDFDCDWVGKGGTVVATWTPTGDSCSFVLSGDSDGLRIDESSRRIEIPADRPRSIALSAADFTLADALDTRELGFAWSTSGGAPWIPRMTVSADGEDSAESGDGLGFDSVLETTVVGPGTLSWSWKMEAGATSGIDFEVDGDVVGELTASGVWSRSSAAVGAGTHTVRFVFWNEGTDPSDRGYVDRVSWFPGEGEPLAVQTRTLPHAIEGIPYSQTISGTGGTLPYRWEALVAPAGLSLSSNGTVSGSPADSGSSRFAVVLSDSNGNETFGIVGIDIHGRLRIEDRSFSALQAPASVSEPLSATGGVEPYSWTGEDLPPGLSLSSGGLLSGTLAEAGSWTAVVTAASSDGQTATKTFLIPVFSEPLAIATSGNLPEAVPGKTYRVPLSATGGVEPLSWRVVSGHFPGNIQLGRDTGTLFADPFAGRSGTHAAVVRVADATGRSAERAFSVSVAETNTETTPVPVPCDWLEWHWLAPYGEYEDAAWGRAANGENAVWECYLAGLDPTDAEDRFLANIEIEDGKPVVTWSPDLNAGGTKEVRQYRIAGARTLETPPEIWDDVTDLDDPDAEDYRFFRVKVIPVPADPFSRALDPHLSFQTGGAAVWTVQPDGNEGDNLVALSGAIAAGCGLETWIETTVSGEGTLYFQWAKTGGSLAFEADGASLSAADDGWTTESVFLSGTGDHTVRWRFRKDGAGDSDDDAGFLDKVVWMPIREPYTVRFLPNGGEGDMEDQTLWTDLGGTLARNAFRRTDHVFNGWALSPDGDPVFADGETVRNLASAGETVTLFAVWIQGFFAYEESAGEPKTITITGLSGGVSPTRIDIPAEIGGVPVTRIADGAFAGVASLRSVRIPDSVTDIGNNAFLGCGLLDVTLPGRFNVGDSIENRNTIRTITYTGTLTFSQGRINGYTALETLVLPENVSDPVGYGNLCWNCPNLSSATIPGTFRWDRIVDSAAVLTNLVFTQGTKTIMGKRFAQHPRLLSVTIPDGVTSIGDYAFCNCSNLTSVTIPGSVANIGEEAFRGCFGLTSIEILGNVTNFGSSAFFDCAGIKDVVVSGSFKLSEALTSSYKTITNAVVAQGATNIGDEAFFCCFGLTSITIPETVASIGCNAFRNCSELTTVTIPDSVTNIMQEAFKGCTGLTSITISEGVTSIGQNAFYGCWELKDVVVPGHFQLSTIFPSSYTTITNAIIKQGVTSIESWAFYGCSGLTTITIPDSVTSIGSWAFDGCSGLTTITIPDSVTSIGGSAFYGCSGLSSIVIPNSVTSIGHGVFQDCSGLSSIVIPNNVTNVGSRAFYGCSALESVTIPDGVTSIGERAFYGCSGLSSITIPDNVASIEYAAFQDCSGLSSIVIPNSVTSIGGWAFDGCSNLSTLSLPSRFKGNSSILVGIPNGCEVVWVPDVYTLKFDANGGTGEMDDMEEIACGASVTLPVCGFSRSGWTFIGWARSADGAVEWSDGETVADGFGSLASGEVSPLFARWSRGTYTVRFDANGGIGLMPDATFGTDIAQMLPQNAFSKNGMAFGGWTTNGASAVVWPAGASVENLAQPGGTVTLKAVWIELRGLDVLYYDISSSVALGYTESEMASYFAGLTPTIETNSLAFGETLDPGISNVDNLDYSEFVDFGYTGLRFSSYETTTRFHGVYGSMSRNTFCVFATGTINVETSGTYRFGAVADDRFVLFIDGVRVLNVKWNEVAAGNPASGTGSIDLSAGLHTLSIGFSEGSGGEGFFVQWKRPGDSTWSPLPQSILGGSN